ncbi:hypothetical protein [Niallia taxi]|uniref:hypothetical protein n=1 Tax=Niallia taxi TaxID=2499688 RepID=UPI0015F4F95E|nr:hypothetical protein [Niallia taxi]
MINLELYKAKQRRKELWQKLMSSRISAEERKELKQEYEELVSLTSKLEVAEKYK